MFRVGSFHTWSFITILCHSLIILYMNILNSRLKEIPVSILNFFFRKGGGGGVHLMTKMKFSDDIHIIIDFLSSVTTF